MANKVVVDTSFLIELLDRERRDLVDYIIDKEVLIPFIVLYEYLYGYRVIGRDVSRRKKILEDLGDHSMDRSGYTVEADRDEV